MIPTHEIIFDFCFRGCLRSSNLPRGCQRLVGNVRRISYGTQFEIVEVISSREPFRPWDLGTNSSFNLLTKRSCILSEFWRPTKSCHAKMVCTEDVKFENVTFADRTTVRYIKILDDLKPGRKLEIWMAIWTQLLVPNGGCFSATMKDFRPKWRPLRP